MTSKLGRLCVLALLIIDFELETVQNFFLSIELCEQRISFFLSCIFLSNGSLFVLDAFSKLRQKISQIYSYVVPTSWGKKRCVGYYQMHVQFDGSSSHGLLSHVESTATYTRCLIGA